MTADERRLLLLLANLLSDQLQRDAVSMRKASRIVKRLHQAIEDVLREGRKPVATSPRADGKRD